jgi:hypothetical protein
MGIFTPAQHESHVQTTTELIQSVQVVQEVANGYEFVFPNESELIIKIAEFISNERLCCPFLKFSLSIVSNIEPIALSLTGPTGTQEFLRAEFDGAIS